MNNNEFLQDFMESLFRSMLMNMKYEAKLMANKDASSITEERSSDSVYSKRETGKKEIGKKEIDKKEIDRKEIDKKEIDNSSGSDPNYHNCYNPNSTKEDLVPYSSNTNTDAGSDVGSDTDSAPDSNSNSSTITNINPDSESKISPTPYDDVYRTLVTDCPALVIPLVNELFNEHYSEDEFVTPLQNERFIMVPGSKELKRVTDSYIQISGSRRYHIECQSIQDNSMLIRIFEYDAQIALESSELTGDTLNVKFPESGLIYLRHDDRTPSELKVRVHFQNGDSITYPIKVLKAKSYTIDEIFSKRLYFLIPFHLFTFEPEFGKIEAEEERLRAFNAYYEGIVSRLDESCLSGFITEYNKQTIMKMANRVATSLARRHSMIQEGVNKIMGGQILDHPAKDILNQGISIGIEQGIEQGIDKGEAKLSLLISKLIKLDRIYDIDRVTADPAYREELYTEFGIA